MPHIPEQQEISLEGSRESYCPIISATQTDKLLRNGCQEYLVYVIDTQKEELKLEDIQLS